MKKHIVQQMYLSGEIPTELFFLWIHIVMNVPFKKKIGKKVRGNSPVNELINDDNVAGLNLLPK